MAERNWKAVPTDGNLATASNYEEGVAPVAGDDVVINKSAQNITLGLTPAFRYGTVVVGPGHTGSIGSVGASWVVGADRVVVCGAGPAYWISPSATYGGIDQYNVQLPNDTTECHVGTSGITGTIVEAALRRGKVFFEEMGNIARMFIDALAGSDSALIVELNYPGITNVRCGHGTVTHNKGTIADLLFANGLWTMLSGASTVGQVNYLDMLGGYFTHKSNATMARARIMGGTFDLSQDNQTKTISECELWENGIIRLDNADPTSINLTSGIRMVGAGRVYAPIGGNYFG